MITFLCGLALLAVGGFFYGAFVERFFGVSDRPTPAFTKRDNVDYVPISTWHNELIHLLNIAGTGPILGPIQGILFGPVAFITIPLGCILAGAVQDFMIGMISIRHDGLQIQGLTKYYFGNTLSILFGLFTCLAVLLFGVTCVYTPGDLFVQNVLHQNIDLSNYWLWVIYGLIFTYYLIATLLPIDKIIGRFYPYIGAFFVLTAILLFIYIFVKRLPLTELSLENIKGLKPHFFPIFFVTVACGIASGFHSTQATIISRTLTSERRGRAVFYNMMLAEGFIAMVWAAVTMGIINKWGISVNGGATEMLSQIVSRVLMIFSPDGNSAPAGTFGLIITTAIVLGVIALPITSGDTALRSARLMIGEALGLNQSKARNRLTVGLAIFALVAILLFVAKYINGGFTFIWRYFAWANQTIVVFSLAVATAWCISQGKKIWVTVLPGAFYLFITSSFILNAPIGFNLSWKLSYSLAGLFSFLYIVYFIYSQRKHCKQKDFTK